MLIISLVPSLTELLYDLGVGEEVIGITKFCVHPDKWFRSKTRVGGTKKVKMEIIHQLKPDLIIANKEENTKEQIEELQKHYRVCITDIKNLNDALNAIKEIGEITNKIVKANLLAEKIEEKFSHLLEELETKNWKLKTCYLIWQNPFMVAGGDTFINDMMSYCGFENVFKNITRYPEKTIAKLKDMHCELLLLSSEPFPFKQKHVDELQKQLPDTKIILVDGEMFSWYGSRLLLAADYFKDLAKALRR